LTSHQAMAYRTPSTLKAPTHGILIPISIVFWHPYPWYIECHIHGISSNLSMVYQTL
jgi:hypothetical protein